MDGAIVLDDKGQSGTFCKDARRFGCGLVHHLDVALSVVAACDQGVVEALLRRPQAQNAHPCATSLALLKALLLTYRAIAVASG